MLEISINIEVLEEKIAKLETLKTDCENITLKTYDGKGAGQSTELAQSICDEYKIIKDAMTTLVSNAIVFFNGIKESAITADSKASEKLSV